MAKRRVKVRGVRRDAVDTEMYALALWLQAKREVQEKRRRQAEDRDRRREARNGK